MAGGGDHQYGAVSPYATSGYRPRETGPKWSTIAMAAIGTALVLALVSASNDHAGTTVGSNTRQLAAMAKQQTLQEASVANNDAPAGTGKELIKSVQEAVTEQPTAENSHYIGGYTDKSVHLLVIILLIIVPGGIYFFWKTQKRLNDTGHNALFDTDKVTADFNKGMGDFGNQLGTFGETAKGWGSGLVDSASGLASQAGSHISAAGSKMGIGKKEGGDEGAPAETKK